ncbi:MAG TPA: site-2 protease family protein [bacterium]|nr:site-2 protease family protein [bacterium]
MIRFLPRFVILVFSIVFHEVAHGRVALWRGDTTARDAGRLTLNPLPHIDLFGTILFPLFLILTRSPFLFGWAKPVPVNPSLFGKFKKDLALVGASGPASNLALAAVLGMLFRFTAPAMGAQHALIQALYFGVMINLVLAFFNLMPIPPLDGSRIAAAFMPDDLAESYLNMGRYGFFIILLLFFLGVFQRILFPLVAWFMKLIIGPVSGGHL